MNKIIAHIKAADKRKLFIYLFSFVVFWIVNNILRNVIALSSNERVYLWFWNFLDCLKTINFVLIFSFEGLKILLFMLMIYLIRKNPEALFNEFFISYFIYDLVFLLATIFNLLPDTFYFRPAFMLSSSPQFGMNLYINDSLWSSQIVSLAWTIALVALLYKYKKAGFMFYIHRLFIIPFSVPLASWVIYFILK